MHGRWVQRGFHVLDNTLVLIASFVDKNERIRIWRLSGKALIKSVTACLYPFYVGGLVKTEDS